MRLSNCYIVTTSWNFNLIAENVLLVWKTDMDPKVTGSIPT